MNSTDRLWRFVRMTDSDETVERWLYSRVDEPDLEQILGPVLLLEALQTDFRDPRRVELLRDAVRRVLGPPSCRCVTWRDDEQLVLGLDEEDRPQSVEEFLSTFVVKARKTPWLYALACAECSRLWLLGVDSRDDRYRLHAFGVEEARAFAAGRWPTVFDHVDALWPSDEWLKLYGYESLDDWQRKNRPGSG